MPDFDERGLRRSLIRANRSVRVGRPPHPTHTNVAMREYVAATGPAKKQVHMFQIWFRTRGCSYDRAGQCSMCNYGIGPEIEPHRIARSLERRLTEVPEGASVYLSPSGSLLDDVEVPPELRDELLGLVATRRPALFAFETRPELFTPGKLSRIRELLPGTELVGQVGVESWNPRVRNLCHLKPTPQKSYLGAGEMMRQQGFGSVANITLGGLGLSQREAYDDALDSVRGVRQAGFTTPMVFPLSAKSGTLLGFAAEQGLWEPPTLWMLIRVLATAAAENAAPDQRSDLSISWFDPEVDDVVRRRPDGCDACRPFLVETLHAFRADPRPATLAAALAWDGCDCPARTDAALAVPADDPGYLARLVEIADRWQAAHPEPEDRRLLPII